jgi:hypothetical protein
MVRNEVDVIEAFVRHNLKFLDALWIVDHGSFDGTSEILSELCSEGLPTRVMREEDPAFRQSEILTALAREALSRGGADFVLALDADEFLKVESREALERALAGIPHGLHATIGWQTYVPDAFDQARFGPGHLWWRRTPKQRGLRKVIVSPALIDHPVHMIASGNHFVIGATGSALPHARLREEAVALAHCPVRSRWQLEAKVIIGWLATLAEDPDRLHLAPHWRRLYRRLRDGEIFDEERLREIAANYGIPQKDWRPASALDLVEDPVHVDAEQRYFREEMRNPLPLLLRFTEALVSEERIHVPESSHSTASRYVTL